MGQDSRQFSIEKGRLRLASVQRTNPLGQDDGTFDNPMYLHANNGGAEYDTAVNVFGVTGDQESRVDDNAYDRAGNKRGISPLDIATESLASQ